MSALLPRTTQLTHDGFICHMDGTLEEGISTTTTTTSSVVDCPDETNYDVIIIGGGFAGLICARELSHRNLRVLIIEGRDRIGGRAFTAEYDQQLFDLGGTAIHWNQPHLWSEITRYGLAITECQGATTERVSLLLDNASRLKITSMAELRPKIQEIFTKFSDVDGVQGRSVIPMPQNPLVAVEVLQKYDQLSIQDRFDQISDAFGNDEEMRQLIAALLAVNMQTDMAAGGLIDHLCFWAHGNYEANTRSDLASRYKLADGMSALAQAILDDCRDVQLVLSMPVISVHSIDNQVTIRTSTGQLYTSRVAVSTVPLNVLNTIHFEPSLSLEKQRAISQGQCRGGIKFWAKLQEPVGTWCGYAPYPNPITAASTEDTDGSIIVAFGPDDKLNIRDIAAVEHELDKFLPGCKVKYVIGHDWRNDPFVRGTWSWYRPGQMSSSLRALQASEALIYFASADWSSGWKGCIDGAFERGLAAVRDILRHLKKQRV